MPEINEQRLLEMLIKLTPEDLDYLTRFAEALERGEDVSHFYEERGLLAA